MIMRLLRSSSSLVNSHAILPGAGGGGGGRGYSHMEPTGMQVGNFEFNP